MKSYVFYDIQFSFIGEKQIKFLVRVKNHKQTLTQKCRYYLIYHLNEFPLHLELGFSFIVPSKLMNLFR